MALALGEEVVTADEQAVVADFIAFLKEASLARAGTGPVRRFNQTRTTGCVRAEFTVPDGAARRAARRPVRHAGVLPGAHPVRQRDVRVGPRSGHSRHVDQADRRAGREPDARLDRARLRAVQPSGDAGGHRPGVPRTAQGQRGARAEAHHLLRHAPAIGGDRRRRRGAPHLPSRHPVFQRHAVPLRRRQGGEVRRAAHVGASQREAAAPDRQLPARQHADAT